VLISDNGNSHVYIHR
jgi:hypothetical protein